MGFGGALKRPLTHIPWQLVQAVRAVAVRLSCGCAAGFRACAPDGKPAVQRGAI